MKIYNKTALVLVVLGAFFTLGLTSCGVASFDVTVNPSDVKDIDLSLLAGDDYIIRVETYVETGDTGIDLSQLVYDYKLQNRGSNDLTIEVRLSLYGEATTDSNNKVSVLQDSDGDGYCDTVISGGTLPVWLSGPYKNTVSSEGYGWVSLMGSPESPVDLPADTVVSDTTELIDNDVVDRILKQDGIWVNVYIRPSSSLGIGDFPLPTSYMDVIDQSIRVVGSKDTGYFPGFFGTM